MIGKDTGYNSYIKQSNETHPLKNRYKEGEKRDLAHDYILTA